MPDEVSHASPSTRLAVAPSPNNYKTMMSSTSVTGSFDAYDPEKSLPHPLLRWSLWRIGLTLIYGTVWIPLALVTFLVDQLFWWLTMPLCWIMPCTNGTKRLPPVKPSDEKYALVTGGGHGIGRAISEELAKRKFNLILAARNQSKLTEAAEALAEKYSVKVLTLPADLGVAGGAEKLHRDVNDLLLTKGDDHHVAILVNNAGRLNRSAYLSEELSGIMSMTQLNSISYAILMRLFGEDMAKRGCGRILNNASVVGWLPGPSCAMYHATKAFVVSLSQSVGYELRPHGVGVTCLTPPGTKSSLFAGEAENALIAHDMLTEKTEKVAAFGVRRLMKGARLAAPGGFSFFIDVVSRCMPEPILLYFAHLAWWPLDNLLDPRDCNKTLEAQRPKHDAA
ncbi:unnamed protein product [Vitrella brassicaformis CCMP3155]|uniref:Ketoreductase (KR) domain-containing protein n=1 Tax=Vitrella brassicaformis (strain CCMP3155) TaxID=1169540 RepID=A0A0G4H678_VITBC|nr:unnamed protein product [Vitrella brassicaformis CCMP3155]|eukprot:CEM39335.1 unnamed protein product [Vitrella brassicaformis CCMP3155]